MIELLFRRSNIIIPLCLSALFGCTSSPKQQTVIKRQWARELVTTDGFKKPTVPHFAPPVYSAAHKIVFAPSAFNGLHAFYASNGNSVWKFPVEGGVEGTAVVDGDHVYFGGNDGQFYCVKAETGETVWSFPTRADTLGEATVHGAQVLFIAGNNILYSLDKLSGEKKWMYVRQTNSEFSIRGASKPLIEKGIVYAGFADGAFVALTESSGKPIWEKLFNNTPRFRDIDTEPAHDNLYLYIASFDDAVYKISKKDGSLLWKYPRGAQGRVLLSNGKLFVSLTDHHLASLDADSGKEIWRIPTEGVPSSPIMANNYLIAGESAGQIKVLEPSAGQLITSFETGRGVLASVAIMNGSLDFFTISNQGILYRMEVKKDYIR